MTISEEFNLREGTKLANGKSVISQFSGIDSISNRQEDTASIDFEEEMESPGVDMAAFSNRMSINEKLEEHQEI